LVDFRSRIIAFLEATTAVPTDDTDLFSTELKRVPALDETHRRSLAASSDHDLRYFSKLTNAQAAWCIAALRYLTAHDWRATLTFLDHDDPAGIVPAFVANLDLTIAETDDAVLALCNSGDIVRAEAAANLLYRHLHRPLLYNHGQLPELTILDSLDASASQNVLIAILKRVALAIRSNANSVIPNQLQTWLNLEQIRLRNLLTSGSVVNSLMKDAKSSDVFMLSILAKCEDLGLMTHAASRSAHEKGEALFKDRFKSALDVNYDAEAWHYMFRDFELPPFVEIVSRFGLESTVLIDLFEGLATDIYWSLVKPTLTHSDRKRAIMLTAIAALVSTNRSDVALRSAADTCVAKLRSSNRGGFVQVSNQIHELVLTKTGLDLPFT